MMYSIFYQKLLPKQKISNIFNNANVYSNYVNELTRCLRWCLTVQLFEADRFWWELLVLSLSHTYSFEEPGQLWISIKCIEPILRVAPVKIKKHHVNISATVCRKGE